MSFIPRSVCSFQATQLLAAQLQYYTIPTPANYWLVAMNALLNSGGWYQAQQVEKDGLITIAAWKVNSNIWMLRARCGIFRCNVWTRREMYLQAASTESFYRCLKLQAPHYKKKENHFHHRNPSSHDSDETAGIILVREQISSESSAR